MNTEQGGETYITSELEKYPELLGIVSFIYDEISGTDPVPVELAMSTLSGMMAGVAIFNTALADEFVVMIGVMILREKGVIVISNNEDTPSGTLH